jgi:hypothetical protein
MELGRRPGGMDQNGREVNLSMPQGMYPHTGYGQQPIIPPYGFDPRSITQPMLAQQYQQPQRFGESLLFLILSTFSPH